MFPLARAPGADESSWYNHARRSRLGPGRTEWPVAGVRRGLMLVVSGPAGVGKTTLLKRLMAADPNLAFSVSMTTRKPRVGEVDGVDYHFVDAAGFDHAVATGELLEWAHVHTNRYGTPRSLVEAQRAAGHDVVLDIDVQGAGQVRASGVDACSVFLLPPSRDELWRRLVGRESETQAELAVRRANADTELAQWPLFDYAIVNDDVDQALAKLESVVAAERCRVRAGWAPRGWDADG